jgi:hypothetical protein
MSGASQTPLSGTICATNPETLGIRISAEEQETNVSQNSGTTQAEYKSRSKTFKFSIAGLLALIPKVYLCR